MSRRGKLLLTKNSVRILGGEVEELLDQFSTENVLTQKIGTKIDKQIIHFPKPAVVRPVPGEGRTCNINPTPTNPPSLNTQPNMPSRNNNPIRQQILQPINRLIKPAKPQEIRQTPNNTEFLDDVNWDDDDFPMMDDDDDFPAMDDDDDLLLSMSDKTFQSASSAVNSNSCRASVGQTSRPDLPASYPRPQAQIFPSKEFNPPLRSPALTSAEPQSPFVQPLPRISFQPPVQKPQPVARISPLTIEPIPPGSKTPKKVIQTSIHSFMKPKKPRLELDVPDFDLEDDLEIFEQIELPPEVEAKLISSEPFIYLSVIKKEVEKNPSRRYVATIKVKTKTSKSWFSYRIVQFFL